MGSGKANWMDMLMDRNSYDAARSSREAEAQSAEGQDLVRSAKLRYYRRRSIRGLGESSISRRFLSSC